MATQRYEVDLPPFFAAVEGPTGVGKTTLVDRMSGLIGARAYFDPFEANPFLSRQYPAATLQEANDLGLVTELTFAALRIVQLRHMRDHLASGGSVLADWSMVKHAAFAASTLKRSDRIRMSRTCALWTSDLPVPDLLIYLRADAQTLATRVAGRGRELEAGMTAAFLSALRNAFDEALAIPRQPVLVVDATVFNVFDDAAVELLATQVRDMLREKGCSGV